MDKKKKNLLEMRKLGFSQKTLSLMTESQVAMILEKIKKKEAKEAETTTQITKTTNYKPDDTLDGVPAKQVTDKGKPSGNGGLEITTTQTKKEDTNKGEQTEGKKKKKKYNPWAVCTASVGRKNKKKYEDCVMGVKKKLKEGRNPYEYLIESKMEEIVENNLSPKMTKGELLRIIAEKKMMMKKPIGKMISMKGETMEGDTKTAPTRTLPKTEPGTKPSHPGRKSKDKPNPKPKASEDEKERIIDAIFKLIEKETR